MRSTYQIRPNWNAYPKADDCRWKTVTDGRSELALNNLSDMITTAQIPFSFRLPVTTECFPKWSDFMKVDVS